LHGKEGDPIPLVVQVEGKDILWIEIDVGVRNLGFRIMSMENGQPIGPENPLGS